MHCRKSKQLGASIEDDKLKIGSNFGNLYPVHVTRFYHEKLDYVKESVLLSEIKLVVRNNVLIRHLFETSPLIIIR